MIADHQRPEPSLKKSLVRCVAALAATLLAIALVEISLPSPPDQAQKLELRSDGIGRHHFGDSTREVSAGVSAAVGYRPYTLEEGPAETARWGGLELRFLDGELRSWSVTSSDPALATASGLRVGSTAEEFRSITGIDLRQTQELPGPGGPLTVSATGDPLVVVGLSSSDR